MELVEKGASAAIGSIKKLLVTLAWSIAADFDLAALVQDNNDNWSMIYFNNKGDLNSYPYIKLDQDAGVGDSVDDGGENEENLTIEKLEGTKKVHLVCWDYGAIKNGSAARFKESDVKIKVVDDKGTDHQVSLDTGDLGNICCIASIENSPIGANLINSSEAGILKEFKNTNGILEVLNLN